MRGTIQGQGVDYFFPWFMAVIVERGGREWVMACGTDVPLCCTSGMKCQVSCGKARGVDCMWQCGGVPTWTWPNVTRRGGWVLIWCDRDFRMIVK